MFQYFKLKRQIEKQQLELATNDMAIKELQDEKSSLQAQLKHARNQVSYFRQKYEECVILETNPPAFSKGTNIGHIVVMEVLPPADHVRDLAAGALLAIGFLGIGIAVLASSIRRAQMNPIKQRRYRIYDGRAQKESTVTESELREMLPATSEPMPI